MTLCVLFKIYFANDGAFFIISHGVKLLSAPISLYFCRHDYDKLKLGFCVVQHLNKLKREIDFFNRKMHVIKNLEVQLGMVTL